MLDLLEAELERAQSERVDAEMALMEATAAVETAREASNRLTSAVAALKGESAPPVIENRLEPIEVAPDNSQQAITGEQTPERQATADMTPEQFDAQRRKKQRAREKEEQANNPHAHLKCSGCGKIGSMVESIIEAPSGAPVRMMICNKCGNQSF